MNECEQIDNLESEISFLQSMANLVERAADMRQAKVPMSVYISSLGVYVCNNVAVHNNSQKSKVAQNSTSNNTESDVIALANKFLGLHKDPLTKTVMPLFIKWVQQTHIS